MHIKKQNLFIIILIILSVSGIFYFLFLYKKENMAVSYGSNDIYINTPEDLVSFGNNVNQGENYTGVHVMLGNDLDMSGILNFLPIGIWESGNYFCGVFDGRGYTIRNLKIDTDLGNSNSGLFGTLGGTVCNLNMEDCYVSGSACGAVCSIAADEHARIYNCSINNCVIDADYTDIIGGQYLGKLENNVINGEGDINALNDNLRNISAKCHDIVMYKWIEQDGKPVLSTEETERILNMYIHIDSLSYTGNIQPYYAEEEQVYYFILPNNKLSGNAFLKIDDGNGKTAQYPVDLAGEGGEEKNIFVFAGDELILSENDEIKTNEVKQPYAIKICFTENTSSVFINTKKRWVMDYLKSSKNYMISGNIEVLNENGIADYKGGLKRIQGRGNNSWKYDKKGFNLELMNNGNLLDMGVETHFALIPGYRDSSLITYKIVQDLCKETKKEFAPDYRFANLYVDGEYQGIYLLAEKVNVGYNRIDIDTENHDITGSYLFELDNFYFTDEPYVFNTEYNNVYTVKYPSIMKEEQMTYCQERWNQFERAARSEDGYNTEGIYYTEYLDLDSAAQFWLYCEISGERSINGSIYFYKENDKHGDGKFHVIYPWDVEHSFSDEELITENVMVDENTDSANYLWYALYCHEDFKKAVYQNWINSYRPAVEKLIDDSIGENPDGVSSLEFYKEKYNVSFHYNELLWGEDQNIDQKTDFIKKFLEERIPYLDEALKN